MNIQQQFGDDGVPVSRVSTEDGTRVVVDFGEVSSSAVDIVGETAIVIADGEQFELSVPADAQAFITNGVLTIEVNE